MRNVPLQTSLQREADALTTINRLAASVDLALATVETQGVHSLIQRPVNAFISTDICLAGWSLAITKPDHLHCFPR